MTHSKLESSAQLPSFPRICCYRFLTAHLRYIATKKGQWEGKRQPDQSSSFAAIKPRLWNCTGELFQFGVWWFTLIARKKCFGPSIQEVWEPSCRIVASIKNHCAMDQYHRQSISLLLSLGSVLVLLDLTARWWEVVCTAQRMVWDTVAERKAMNGNKCLQREKGRRRQQLWKVFAESWDSL